MRARMIAGFLVLGSTLPLVAGIGNAESPSWVTVASREQAPCPSFRSNALPLRHKANRVLDKTFEFLPFHEAPQWQNPGNWCLATGTVV